MTTFTHADTLHRLIKHAIDSGVAESFDEAEAMFRKYRLRVELDSTVAEDTVQQAVLLTTVALARRVFLGGVIVVGCLNSRLLVPMPLGQTLGDAVRALGGVSQAESDSLPTIVIGGSAAAKREGFCIRTAVAGWRGGILPIHSELTPGAKSAMPLAGMLAAALAVNEAYMYANGNSPIAGRRVVGLSLWRPGLDHDWLDEDSLEPMLTYLPSRLWLIGLGHLGQAYLWGLGLLPYKNPAEVSIVLQDIDIITPSTESTSMLTDAGMVGQMKTRAMATWAAQRGFSASIQERLFAANFTRQSDEPAIALCGLDNAASRRVLDQVGFELVVEAGLGRGYSNFRTLRLHTLPGRRPAADIWKATCKEEKIMERPAYAKLLANGSLDQCGMTLLAGKAVGAPFVGATAATLALAEVLRLLHGGQIHQLIDLDLLSTDHRMVSLHHVDFSHLNPGFTMAY